jgi:hypothetical protein
MTIYSGSPAVEQTATLSSSDRSIFNKRDMPKMYSPNQHYQPHVHIPTAEVFGLEVHPMEAAALVKTSNDFMDKVLLFVSHGEIAENEDGTVGNVNASLTGKVRKYY